jgi:signal transduction histidine kinase
VRVAAPTTPGSLGVPERPGAIAAVLKPSPVAVAVLAVAGLAFALALADAGEADTLYGSLRLFVGASFVGVGLYAWWRRPSNRFGPLMIATGFLWFLANVATYATDPTAFTLAGVVGGVYHATTIHLLLAFPSGRLESRPARLTAIAGYVVVFGGNLLVYLVSDFRTDFGCPTCPENVLQVVHSPALADAVRVAVNLLAAALVAYVLLLLITNWGKAQGWRRRALTPLLVAGVASTFLLGLTFFVLAFNEQIAQDVFTAAAAAFVLVPYAFLLGLVRSATLSGGAVGELVRDLTGAGEGGELREELRRALGDSSLELIYWLPESGEHVDGEGRPVELPAAGDARGFARVELDGRRVGAIVYDAMLVDDPPLVDAVGAAAALAMERERLDAELRAKVEELRASRERLVAAGYEERRRLERNLHDGAQQRFVSLALSLRLARSRLTADPAGAAEILDTAGRELQLGLGELRDLARGIHPAILSDRGLDAALAALAARAPFEVELQAAPGARLPERVESATYFVVSEVLANAIKHARASHAKICVVRDNAQLSIEVSDDGVGGADPASGSGLRGLIDRVSALGGRLQVDSRPGAGTTVRAEIPCE